MRLKRPIRAAIVFTLVWVVCVGGLAAYERFFTIGNANGPWALYGHYGSLVFYHVQIQAHQFSFWLKRQLFFATLLLPIVVVWFTAAFLVPAIRWVRGESGT